MGCCCLLPASTFVFALHYFLQRNTSCPAKIDVTSSFSLILRLLELDSCTIFRSSLDVGVGLLHLSLTAFRLVRDGETPRRAALPIPLLFQARLLQFYFRPHGITILNDYYIIACDKNILFRQYPSLRFRYGTAR